MTRSAALALACVLSACGGRTVVDSASVSVEIPGDNALRSDTDDAGAGQCVAACEGTCTQEGCVVRVAPSDGSYVPLVFDATSIYWSESSSGKLLKVPAVGGAPITLAADRLNVTEIPAQIAVDRAGVYWANDSALVKVPVDGGALVTLVPDQSVGVIAVSSTQVYWSNSSREGNALMARPLEGGEPVTLAIDRSGMQTIAELAVDDSAVYWMNNLGIGNSVCPGRECGVIVKAPLGGGTQTTLVASGNPLSNFVLREGDLYWADLGGSQGSFDRIMKMPALGGSPITLGASMKSVSSIAVDAESIYWTVLDDASLRDGEVLKMPLAGGAPVTLATHQTAPGPIGVDGDRVYWLNGGVGAEPGALMRLTPSCACR